jgi:hypothetical protein
MVVSIAKRVAVRFLEGSSDPRMQEAAKWINDAEKAAVDYVLNIIVGGFQRDGTISKRTADQILQGKEKFKNEGASAVRDSPSATPFLDQYKELLSTIATLGSMRGAIYLQGFLHTPACSSLWRFAGKVPPALAVIQKPLVGLPYLGYERNDLTIFLIREKLVAEDFKARNKAIGNNYSVWQKTVIDDSMTEVVRISEDDIDLKHIQFKEEKVRKGTKKVREEVAEHIAFSDRTAGVEAMIDSLPIALEARDYSLAALKTRLEN